MRCGLSGQRGKPRVSTSSVGAGGRGAEEPRVTARASSNRLTQNPDVVSLQTFGRIHRCELHSLIGYQHPVTRRHDRGMMNENIFTALGLYESVALISLNHLTRPS